MTITSTLPPTVEALIKGRVVEKKRSLNDQCDDTFVSAWGEKTFRPLHEGKGTKNTVHGHAVVDRVMAALMIKQRAQEMGFVELANAPIYDVVKAMNVVKRRYGITKAKAKTNPAPAAQAA